MAVSNKGIYVSNIVTIPEKPEEAVKPEAEELRAGEDKAGIVPDKTNAGREGSPVCSVIFPSDNQPRK